MSKAKRRAGKAGRDKGNCDDEVSSASTIERSEGASASHESTPSETQSTLFLVQCQHMLMFVYLAVCPNCGLLEKRVEALEKDNAVLPIDNVSLRADNVSLRAGLKKVEDELKTALGDQDMVTLRELCYSVEEQVCREAFGSCALEEYRYRFKHIKDNEGDRKQVAEILSTFQFEEKHLGIIKKCGNTLVHVNRPTLPAARVQELVFNALRSSTKAQKFMEMLQRFNMVDAAGVVNAFQSPWPGRPERHG